ncbi:MAG: metallophosphoesterase [Hyphomicrobiaceae bacterium]|nr:metallophosphoesterase [Hyphomicrobiaceae bacterium]
MRWHVVSDLHLEAQGPVRLAGGDVLIVAGDLCNAAVFVAPVANPQVARQRERVARFAEEATSKYAHVIMIAGNHEHYEGVFEDTVALLRQHLPGFTVLDDEVVEIGGQLVFGGTLWSDFAGRDPVAMETCRRGIGEYLFVTTRERSPAGTEVELAMEHTNSVTVARGRRRQARLRPSDTLAAHGRCLDALRRAATRLGSRPLIVVTHHAPSRHGLNPRFKGNGFDGAFASDLDEFITDLPNCPVWVHGHTHIRSRYRVGATEVIVNCRGFDSDAIGRKRFDPSVGFET